jgi:hypothetical protein
MDIVYILGKGGRHNDDSDLRYSLRSVDLYLTGYDRIFIIGECPKWVQNIIHIPVKDIYASNNKEANIIHKTMKAIDSDISNNFIQLNDDYFFTKFFDVNSDIKNWYKGTLEDSIKAGRLNIYKVAQLRTAKWLKERGFATLNFDGHSPAVMNKLSLEERMKLIDWNKKQYVFRSLYFNIGGESGEYLEDLKIYPSYNYDDTKKKIAERSFFSTSDRVSDSLFRLYLTELFKKKSIFEK